MDELPEEPPAWLHDRIMAALAPRLEELRQEAAEEGQAEE